MTVIEQKLYETLIRELPQITKTLERIASALEKNDNSHNVTPAKEPSK